MLHLDAAGKKLGGWSIEDLGLKCLFLLGMAQRANGNLLVACGDYHLRNADDGRDLLAEIDPTGKVVWRLTREQLVDQIEGFIDKTSGLEEMRVTSVQVLDVPAAKSVSVGPIHTFIGKHCIDCHDDSTSKGDFDITALAFRLDDASNRARWARVTDLAHAGQSVTAPLTEVERLGARGTESPMARTMPVMTMSVLYASPREWVEL